MQDILFRGKVIETGEWIEGDLLKSDEDYFIVPRMGVVCVEYDKKSYTDRFIQLYACQVLPNTVCQCTGLTDINGEKIWSGDILKSSKDGFIGYVEYNSMIASFVVRINDSTPDYYHWSHLNEGDVERNKQLQYTEVIGNIFDNLNLLS